MTSATEMTSVLSTSATIADRGGRQNHRDINAERNRCLQAAVTLAIDRQYQYVRAGCRKMTIYRALSIQIARADVLHRVGDLGHIG